MKYLAVKQTSEINGKKTTYVRAGITDTKRIDTDRLAKMIARGSTVNEEDIVAVFKAMELTLPQIIADGYKPEIKGVGYLIPTISGSIKEDDWRTQRRRTLADQHPDWTAAQVKAAQDKEEFTVKALTSRHLTAGYKIQRNEDFAHSVNDLVEWERVTSGTIDTETDGSTTTDPDNQGGGTMPPLGNE